MTEGGKKKWTRCLEAVLFADRTTVHGPTGHTPFYMVYGREAVLPIETKYPTWRALAWEEVRTREELLTLRARQIEMRDEDVEESMLRKNRRRQEGKEYFDAHHRIRKTPFAVKDIVLRHNTFETDVDKSSSTKLNWRWLGPYKITKADPEKGTYVISELDGTELAGTYHGNRLKKFVERERYFYSPDDEVEPASPDEKEDEEEEVNAGEVRDEQNMSLDIERSRQSKRVLIPVPQLTEEQKATYVRYDEDEEEGEGSASSEGEE